MNKIVAALAIVLALALPVYAAQATAVNTTTATDSSGSHSGFNGLGEVSYSLYSGIQPNDVTVVFLLSKGNTDFIMDIGWRPLLFVRDNTNSNLSVGVFCRRYQAGDKMNPYFGDAYEGGRPVELFALTYRGVDTSGECGIDAIASNLVTTASQTSQTVPNLTFNGTTDVVLGAFFEGGATSSMSWTTPVNYSSQVSNSTVTAIAGNVFGTGSPTSPTTGPTSTITSSPSTISIALGIMGASVHNTYYVAKTGSDSNTTTQAQSSSTPWLTVSHCISQMVSGDTCIVNDSGVYAEHPTITGVMTSETTVKSAAGEGMLSTAPQIQGFSLMSGAKNWTIQGFDITNQNEGSGVEDKSAYGIYINGAINFKILNNYAHEFCSSGLESQSSDTTSTGIFANNHVWRAEMEGIGLAGAGETADNNTVWETVQWPGRLGSTPPGTNPKGVANKDMSGCLTRSGSDGDYFRFFGKYDVFTRNLGFGIPYQGLSSMSRGPCPADPTPTGSTTAANTSCYDSEPHIDGFQTFGTSAQTEDYNFIMKNVILGTYTGSPANCYTAVMGDIESTNNPGNVNTINYIGNVGVCGYAGILDNGSPDQVTGPVRAIGNTIAHIHNSILGGTAISRQGSDTNDSYQNNIFYDVGGGGDGAIEQGTSSTFPTNTDHNIFYMQNGGSRGTYCGTATCPTMTNTDPGFLNYGDNTTSQGGDYHIGCWSQVLGLVNSAAPFADWNPGGFASPSCDGFVF